MQKTLLLFITINLFAISLLSAEPRLQPYDGNPDSIQPYLQDGKWLVVMIWASDCSVCNQEANQYVKFQTLHRGKDASVLGISMDGEQKTKAAESFIEQHAINFPNLIGEPLQIVNLYQQLAGGSWIGTPSFLVYGPDGQLRGAQAGAVPTSVIESFIEREAQQDALGPQKE